MNHKNTLRIAWLLPTAWYYWQPFLSEFSRSYSDSIVFTATWPGYASGLEDKFKVEVIGSQKRLFSTRHKTEGYENGFISLSPNIVGKLFSYNPDVIFSCSFGLWTLFALVFKPLGKWKVIITWEGSSPSVDYRNSPLRLSLRKWMLKNSDACITNTLGGKQYLTEVLNGDGEKVFARFYKPPLASSLLVGEHGKIDFLRINSSLKRPVFTYLGQVIPRKGLHYLLDAVVTLKNRDIDDFSILILGDGPQRQELETFCYEKNIADQVTWAGRIDYKDIGQYLEFSDVFAFPTLEDILGMVVLEAMTLGKPILCSKFAGASEMILSAENGYVFDPYNVDEAADYLLQFINDKSLIPIMGEKSKEFMANNTPDQVFQFLSDVVDYVAKD